MKYITFLFFIIVLFVVSGCSTSKVLVGEFYLEQKQYDKGYIYFKKNLERDNNNAHFHYYYGRFLLAKNNKKEALIHFKKAVTLDNLKADYHSWLGVAYASLNQYKNERKEYLKALSLDKNHLQSLVYLSHNFYEKKDYIKSFEYYNRVLKVTPENKSALFYRAMSLNKLGRKAEEIVAIKEYLLNYPTGAYARQLVVNLNNLGNFDYRNYTIGVRTITLKDIKFKPFVSELEYDSQSSLDILGKILDKNRDIKLHILVYQEKNKELAKQRAKKIKQYLLDKYPQINSYRLKLSWFGKSKSIKVEGNLYKLYESIDFISIIEKKQRN